MLNNLARRGFIFGSATLFSYGLLIGVQRVCYSALADPLPDDEPDAATPRLVTIIQFAGNGRRIGAKAVAKLHHSKEEWKKLLTPAQYEVTRRAATEFAFSGGLYEQQAPGLYRCACCENALFDSATKFDSGTGWPSFYQPLAAENTYQKTDLSYGIARLEVKCTLCDAHLGHLFTDGPAPTGLRYCINSAALRFHPRNT